MKAILTRHAEDCKVFDGTTSYEIAIEIWQAIQGRGFYKMAQ
jgi:hypothetical protein